VLTALLAILSVPIVYSASTAIALDHHGSADFFFWRQVGFVAVGLAAFLAFRGCRRGRRATRCGSCIGGVGRSVSD
jgi:cell division protein FtsW (lipid II flippase)